MAIADDSVLLREGIARLLEETGFQVVGQAGSAEELIHLVRNHEPHVAITDIRMPPTNTDEGIQVAKKIRSEHPDVGVLLLSQYVEEEYAHELLSGDTRGLGYLLKDRVADVDEFASAVRRIAEGGTVLDPALE